MGGWWVADLWQVSPVLVIGWAAWVIFSITLHELAHGWAAIWKGDRTPIELGRMTWNPIVHMGQMSLIVFALLGIAWGSMPVDPSRLRGRYANAIVAAAGPAMNLLLAVVCIVLLSGWILLASSSAGNGIPDHVRDNLFMVLRAGAMLNLVLMIFNLIPIPPLDGWRIASDFSPGFGRLFEGPQGQFIGLAAFIGLWLFGFGRIFTISSEAVDAATALLLMPFL